jgi:hypothetical protein
LNDFILAIGIVVALPENQNSKTIRWIVAWGRGCIVVEPKPQLGRFKKRAKFKKRKQNGLPVEEMFKLLPEKD